MVSNSASFVGALIMAALGVTPEWLLSNPPPWLTHPAVQLGSVFCAFLLVGYGFYVQSRVEIRIPEAIKRRSSLTFDEISRSLSGVSELGLSHQKVLHALMKALWLGHFESSGGKSRVWIPSASGGVLIDDEWLPVPHASIDADGNETDVDVIAAPNRTYFSRRMLLVCWEMGINHIYPTLAKVHPILRDDAKTWNEVKNFPNWELLASIEPHQYDGTYVLAYLNKLTISRRDFLRWFRRLLDGRYDM